MVAAGAAAILGHCFSPFLEFKGGKGVATALGVFAGARAAASRRSRSIVFAVVARGHARAGARVPLPRSRSLSPACCSSAREPSALARSRSRRSCCWSTRTARTSRSSLPARRDLARRPARRRAGAAADRPAPGTTKSSPTSATSGTSANRRSCSRGCGTSSSGVAIVRSPHTRTSRSIVRGPQRTSRARSRPSRRSISWSIARSSSGCTSATSTRSRCSETPAAPARSAPCDTAAPSARRRAARAPRARARTARRSRSSVADVAAEPDHTSRSSGRAITGLLSTPMPSISISTTSPGVEVADARRRPGRDHVADLERHVLAAERDQRRHVEDQIRSSTSPGLTCRSPASRSRRFARIEPRDDARPDRTERVEALRARPLAVFLLQIAHGDVVHARVTEHGIERPFPRDPACALPDHDPELALEVDRARSPRAARSPRRRGSTPMRGFKNISGSSGNPLPISSACAR